MSGDFTPRTWVKNGIEQLADTIGTEVRLKFNGWRPKEEVADEQSAQTPPPAAPAAEPASEPKRTGRKPANPTE